MQYIVVDKGYKRKKNDQILKNYGSKSRIMHEMDRIQMLTE